MLNTMNYDIDITKEPPADDTARQYYFIENYLPRLCQMVKDGTAGTA